MTYIEFHEIEKAFRHAVRAGAPGISGVLQTAIVSTAMRRILRLVETPAVARVSSEREYAPDVAPCDDAEFGMKL